MNITDKQMLADMENIIEACKERRCEECIMRPSGKAYCAVTDATPQNWELPALPAEPESNEPEEPYLCKLFGVGVGERFDVLREDGTVWMEDIWLSAAGMLLVNALGCGGGIETWALADIIEIADKHPDRIRRKPKVALTEDDKVIVRRLLQNGLTWAAMNVSATKNVNLFENEPSVDKGIFRNQQIGGIKRALSTIMLPWVTHEGSPYYLPDLLEGG